MNLKFKILLILVITLNNFSCISKKGFTENKQIHISAEKNEIVFLFFKIFKIFKNSNSIKNQIELIKTLKKDGIIKKDFETEINSENYLTIKVYTNNQIVKIFKINHPLFQEVESFNENNVINKKIIELDSQEFSVRIQTKNSNSSTKIFEKIKDKPEIELLNIKI